jgi:hypothetical protein
MSCADNILNTPEQQAAFERRTLDGATGNCTANCICSLALVCDATFFTGPDGQNSADYAISTMVNRINWVSQVYRSTPFLGITGYGQIVKKVIVYSDNGGGNPVPGTSYMSTQYLQAFSAAGIWTPYCLAHM